MNSSAAGQLDMTVSSKVAEQAAVIAVGDVAEWAENNCPFPESGNLSFLSFEQVDQSALDRLMPELIVSPVLSRTFDCIDLAILLHRKGFSGRYRAISRNFPNPSVIENEVLGCCPRLDFGIILEH